MAGNSRRYEREVYLAGRGTVGGGLSASKLAELTRSPPNYKKSYTPSYTPLEP